MKTRLATSLWSRLVGLLATPTLAGGEGLWLAPCRSIHTFFMRYPIDVAFVDKNQKVLHIGTYPPWRVSPTLWTARAALELPAGTLARTKTQVGDTLVMER